METLGKLFGSIARVKIMRFFLFNQNELFDAASILACTKVKKSEIRRELNLLENAGFIKRKMFMKETEQPKKKAKKVQGWMLNPTFMYTKEFRGLLIDTSLLTDEELTKKISKIGKIKLIIVAGVFIQNQESRVDLLVVGDKLKDSLITSTIRKIESEIGKELGYAVLDTEDFKYRMGVGDKLVRDILDFPYRKVLDRLAMKL